MKAAEVMTTPVVSVRGDTDVRAIAQLLLEKRISAVPVVAEDQRLVGIVSEGDLMRRADLGTEKHRSWWLQSLAAPAELAREFVKAHGACAADVMTRAVIAVGEDTPVARIAELLEEHRIKRVPVVHDGKVVGIVSRANLLHALTAQARRAPKITTAADRPLRERIHAALADQPWMALSQINVIVADGDVEVWGIVDTEDQKEALRLAVSAVEGVRSVNVRTGVGVHHTGYV